MTDPYGALAMQRRGDLGYFDGSAWRSSNQGQAIAPGSGSGTIILSEGSSTTPVTSNKNSTLMVTRYSAMTAADSANAGAIFAMNIDNGTLTQAVGVHAEAEQIGSGDACASLNFATISAGAHVASGHYPVAYGVFGDAINNFPGGDVNGMNPIVSVVSSKAAGTSSAGVFVQSNAINTQSATVTFQALSPGRVVWTAHGFSVGHSVQFSGGTPPVAISNGVIYFVAAVIDSSHFTISATFGGSAINFAGAGSGTTTGTAYVMNGAGVTLENNAPTNSIFDEGYRAESGSVRNVFLSDHSQAVTGYKDSGTHITGIDQSAATISGSAAYFKGTNGVLKLDNLNAGESAFNYYLDAGTAKWLVGKQTDNSYIFFDIAGLHQVAGFLSGYTPAANATDFYLAEGATPTLRQVKWVDPGNLGVNLVAGQRVMVLV